MEDSVKKPEGRPPTWSDPKVLEAEGMAFFKQCEEKGEPITITGLALALNTYRKFLVEYDKKDEFSPTVKKLRTYCENYAEKQMFIGKNPAGAIFALKNYDWRDQQHLDHRNNGKDFPTPIMAGVYVPSNNSNAESNGDAEAH